MKLIIAIGTQTPIEAAQLTLDQVKALLTDLRGRYVQQAPGATKVKDSARIAGSIQAMDAAIERLGQASIEDGSPVPPLTLGELLGPF